MHSIMHVDRLMVLKYQCGQQIRILIKSFANLEISN